MKKILLTIACAHLLAAVHIEALNWMPSNYWFAGDMQIKSRYDHVTYQLYFYNPKTDTWRLSPVKLQANHVLHVGQLLGGIRECPYFPCCDDNYLGTYFLLVPNKPYVPNPGDDPTQNQQKLKDHNTALRSGQILPYVVISRKDNVISTCIVGPLVAGPYTSQKITFNLAAFESKWVANSPWYKHLDNHSPGMAFACSFDTSTGFLNNGTALTNNTFYICGITDFAWPNGWSWTLQGNRPDVPAKDIQGMTIQKLKKDGILQVQKPFVTLEELQEAIDFINWTEQGTFADVIPDHKSTIAQEMQAKRAAQRQKKAQEDKKKAAEAKAATQKK